MGRGTYLNLCDGQRELFKENINNIRELFFERIYPTFENSAQEAEVYQVELWNSLMEQSCDGDTDPSDFVEDIREAAFYKYEILSLMHYRTICMWVACMYQVWVQQLYAFVIQEERINFNSFNCNKGNDEFKYVRKVFERHNQPLDKMSCWAKLDELRLLVNVIKHGEGKSEEDLRKVRPEYFKHSGLLDEDEYDSFALYRTALLEQTLKIDKQDFNEYCDVLLLFWDELPGSMSSSV